MIHIVLPTHLARLANTERDVWLEVDEPVTLRQTLDALEARFPDLRGTIRNPLTGERRAFIRFFACELDLTHEPIDALLPEAARSGEAPVWIVGAMAGG